MKAIARRLDFFHDISESLIAHDTDTGGAGSRFKGEWKQGRPISGFGKTIYSEYCHHLALAHVKVTCTHIQTHTSTHVHLWLWMFGEWLLP